MVGYTSRHVTIKNENPNYFIYNSSGRFYWLLAIYRSKIRKDV
jgi:hypothetical protein